MTNLSKPFVTIELKDAKKFEEITTRLTGQYLAIYLDDKELSKPSVNFPISGGSAQISGDYTVDEAKELADMINLGALPLKLVEKYTQSVGAKLGLASLKDTVEAGIIGTVIILVFLNYFVPYSRRCCRDYGHYLYVALDRCIQFNECHPHLAGYSSLCTRYRYGGRCEYHYVRAY